MQLRGIISNNICNKLIKKSLFSNVRFPCGHNFEDLDIMLPLLVQANSVYILGESLLMYRRRPESTTHIHSLDALRDRKLADKHYISFIQEHLHVYFDKKDLQSALIRRYKVLFRRYCDASWRYMPDKKTYMSQIRSSLNEYEIMIDTKSCGSQIRAASFMLNHIPPAVTGLLNLIYSASKAYLRKAQSLTQSCKRP